MSAAERARPLNVVVVGAGLMGAQIGCEYALAGHRVLLTARNVGRVRERVEQALAMVQDLGLVSAAQAVAASGRVAIGTDLAELEAAADLVVESVPEDMQLKVELMGRAAAVFSGAVLASNTSSLSITELGAAIGAPERTVGTHYWNPPLLMPLVELIVGERTDRSVVEFVRATIESLGKRPVLVEREVPGFVWNRLQLALLREALWIVENGVATPETVDEIVRSGLARRWRLTGPFETAALGGVETFIRVAANLLPVLSDAERVDGLARWVRTEPEALARVKARRDEALAAELLRERTREGAE